MKHLYIVFSRLHSHLKNHGLVLFLFFLGIFTSMLFFIYYYGEYVKVSQLAEGAPEQMSTYRIVPQQPLPLTDTRVAALTDQYAVTVYHTAAVDMEKSKEILSDRFLSSGNSSVTYMARKNNTFGSQTYYGTSDFSAWPGNDCIVLSDSEPQLCNIEHLRAAENPVVVLDGQPLHVIGVHSYGFEARVPYEYLMERHLSADAVEVTLPEVQTKAESAAFTAQLSAQFPGDQVIDPYVRYGAIYISGEEARRPKLMGETVLLLALAFLTFMFLIKYLFDMSRGEDVVYRLAGASRGAVTLVALSEVMLLTLFGAVAAIATHIALRPTLFSVISEYPNQRFYASDYLLVLLVALFTAMLVCIPFLTVVWKKSVIVAKNKFN